MAEKDLIMEAYTYSISTTYNIDNKIFSQLTHEVTLSVENRLKCLQLLQESLEIKQLLSNFSSIVAKVVRPFNIRFQSTNGLFRLSDQESYNFSNNYHLPLSSKSPRIGTITYQSNQKLTDNENKLFIELHKLLVPCLRHAMKFSELETLVFKDHLTKVGNRAYYDESLQRAIDQSNRGEHSLSLMLFDIDHFKPINDNFGHLQGDKVLQYFATILTKTVRCSDMVFRIGGDEFAIILQPGDQTSIEHINDRLIAEINNSQILSVMNFSTSIGYAHWQKGQDADDLFVAADIKLYCDKTQKRA